MDTKTKYESQITEKINYIDNQLEVLQNNVCNICDRLSTVLIPLDKGEKIEETVRKQDTASLCQLAIVLGDKATEIYDINKKLSDILYRLKL